MNHYLTLDEWAALVCGVLAGLMVLGGIVAGIVESGKDRRR